jgi:hypothetical protein
MVVGNFINLGNRKKQQTLSNTMFFKLALILRTRVWIPSTLKFCEASIVHLTDVSSLIINYVILLTLMMFLTSLYHIMCSDMRLPLYMYIVLVMHIYVHMFPNVFLMFNFIFYFCVFFFLELNVVFSCILSCTILHRSHVCIFSFHVLMGTLKILNMSLFIHFDNG